MKPSNYTNRSCSMTLRAQPHEHITGSWRSSSMTKDFKKLSEQVRSAERRSAIPQFDPEAPKPTPAVPVASVQPGVEPQPVQTGHQGAAAASADRPVFLTPVDTTEEPSNHGFHMYPSRHTQ